MIGARAEDRADAVAEPGSGVQVDVSDAAARLRVAVGHADGDGLLQPEHVAEVVRQRPSIGSSVEPGLPKIVVIPCLRNSSKAASRTLVIARHSHQLGIAQGYIGRAGGRGGHTVAGSASDRCRRGEDARAGTSGRGCPEHPRPPPAQSYLRVFFAARLLSASLRACVFDLPPTVFGWSTTVPVLPVTVRFFAIVLPVTVDTAGV